MARVITAALIASGILAFSVFLAKFFAARKEIWKLQAAKVVSFFFFFHILKRKGTRLRHLANAKVASSFWSFHSGEGVPRSSPTRLYLPRRNATDGKAVPQWDLLYQPLALQQNFDGRGYSFRF